MKGKGKYHHNKKNDPVTIQSMTRSHFIPKHYALQINYCSIGVIVLLYQSNMFHCFMADINGEYEVCIASESTLLYHQEDAS